VFEREQCVASGIFLQFALADGHPATVVSS